MLSLLFFDSSLSSLQNTGVGSRQLEWTGLAGLVAFAFIPEISSLHMFSTLGDRLAGSEVSFSLSAFASHLNGVRQDSYSVWLEALSSLLVASNRDDWHHRE